MTSSPAGVQSKADCAGMHLELGDEDARQVRVGGAGRRREPESAQLLGGERQLVALLVPKIGEEARDGLDAQAVHLRMPPDTLRFTFSGTRTEDVD